MEKNLNIEKIQIKYLVRHIINDKYIYDIFTVLHLQNIFIECDLYSLS